MVKLRSKLNWPENRPLFGQRIVVTRTREQASQLSSVIRAWRRGPVPTIKIMPPQNKEDLTDALLACTGMTDRVYVPKRRGDIL
jgi:uroporphyrinogen III methyltransferase/synthase